MVELGGQLNVQEDELGDKVFRTVLDSPERTKGMITCGDAFFFRFSAKRQN